MVLVIMLILVALVFCAISVFAFLRANYCACHHQGECDNPVSQYWLASMLASLVSLGLCCIALHTTQGTMVWFILTGSCFSGALIAAKRQGKKQCERAKAASAPLTNETN
ncbi:hypothetical protein FIU82_03390 [Pseudoalteromonas sp. THAF3]|uniref:DUF3325 domain-containing protein n=1 Tax=Pseudoalteromonas ruthenica TaxID=151081 RepID=A0A5S3Z5X1_9GAMM|nr:MULTISPECIES: hypothetical protein [Pseudoalteromonas]MCG7544514.1 hypothetical protein [Pseudoalteromonas sp. MM17-2]MCG7570189.1 hypothetical protein [Pseudoalteromonas sp. CNC9-20]QFU04066.1 hypothetical protein FIU82_03390 [Pseudoalteromonas sp. THAF3]TMO45731.1 hypothetical protein CWC24_11630 [Pseudoalteromonas ruthenica]TMO50757.1 hypothetical protein CWC23_10305 [Pseudoalteromonas ruthenica]